MLKCLRDSSCDITLGMKSNTIVVLRDLEIETELFIDPPVLGKLSSLFKMKNVRLGVGKVERGGDISGRV